MRPSYNAERQGNVPRPEVAQGASVPSPIEGWDAVSPLANMSPKRAVRMINWFPQQGYVELRRGFDIYSALRTDDPVETVAAYQGSVSNALFACSDDTIFNITDGSAPTADVTGLGNVRFQFVNFTTTGGNFLYMVNGADDPQFFDGSTWDTATIANVSGSDLISLNAYKNRLWFVENGTTDAWYLDVDSIQGDATAFPLGGFFTLGGYLMAIGTWSVDGGNGPEDYIVFVSSRGQVVIYNIGDPDTPEEVNLVGVFNMGSPIGRRCLYKVGADLAIICVDGVVPISRAMVFDRAAVAQVSITKNIQRVMNESARAYGNNFGWQLIGYPRGTRAILNVPITEGGEQEQYVMNTLSGAWCKFTGMNANCWELYNDDPYFGGNDGNVYLADTGGTDYNSTLEADLMTAYNYFGDRGHQKKWSMCRPQITTDSQAQLGLAFNTDFQDNAPIATPTTPATLTYDWDAAGSLWDQALWAGEVTNQSNWTSVTGLGYCASIRLVVNINDTITGSRWGFAQWGIDDWAVSSGSEVVLQVNGFDLMYERGSIV